MSDKPVAWRGVHAEGHYLYYDVFPVGLSEEQRRGLRIESLYAAPQSTDEARTDAALLEFLEERARRSRTGVSIDWAPSCEGDSSGFRVMWHHQLCERKKTIRAAIAAAFAEKGLTP